MNHKHQYFIASILLVAGLATAQANSIHNTDGETDQRITEHHFATQQPTTEEQMASWQADVLNNMLATWKPPSDKARSETWAIQVKTDPHGRLLNLKWISPTGNRSIDRSIINAFKDTSPYPAPPDAEAAKNGITFIDEASARRPVEEQLANAAAIAKIKNKDPLHAYLSLASFRYKKCESIANNWLDPEKQRLGITFVALPMIEDCVKEEESALTADVQLALQVAPENVSDQIKSLHAYTVASLRALTNFYQSVIEARQARAERSTGIDERATRIALDL